MVAVGKQLDLEVVVGIELDLEVAAGIELVGMVAFAVMNDSPQTGEYQEQTVNFGKMTR